MSNEEKVKRLERLVAEKTSAAKDLKFVFAAEGSVAEFTADAAVLREAAQVMRELGALLTSPDWKTMYEAQERDLAALRKELEGLRQESRIAELEAERDAAKAGEARAVEALKRIGEKARWILLDQCVKRGHDPRSVVSDWSLNVDDYLRDEIEGIVFTLDAQPALDWLAQREREAAAEVWKTAIMLAHGCHDYGGGHFGEKYQAFQHGIDTVISVLEAKRDGDDSLQIKVVEHVGAAALRARKEVGE